jgi:hypothetical protein
LFIVAEALPRKRSRLSEKTPYLCLGGLTIFRIQCGQFYSKAIVKNNGDLSYREHLNGHCISIILVVK